MKILYVGDVMAGPGIKVVEAVLPKLRRSLKIDGVIAQAENVSNGKGLSLEDFERLKRAGVDAYSGGDHTVDRPELFPLLEDATAPVIGPANMHECPGPGFKYVTMHDQRVLCISLLGHVVGRYAEREFDNPLKVIDRILAAQANEPRTATIVNFHGDYSSEKFVIGHYLDGRVSAVIGDHWHVPSADAAILPGGTAHITDVGMCGSLDSSLGIRYDVIVKRWLDGLPSRNEIETNGRMQFNALMVTVDDLTRLATEVRLIQQILPGLS